MIVWGNEIYNVSFSKELNSVSRENSISPFSGIY